MQCVFCFAFPPSDNLWKESNVPCSHPGRVHPWLHHSRYWLITVTFFFFFLLQYVKNISDATDLMLPKRDLYFCCILTLSATFIYLLLIGWFVWDDKKKTEDFFFLSASLGWIVTSVFCVCRRLRLYSDLQDATVRLSNVSGSELWSHHHKTAMGIYNISLHLNVEMYLKWLWNLTGESFPPSAACQVTARVCPDNRGTKLFWELKWWERDPRCREEGGECQLHPEEARFKVTAALGGSESSIPTWSAGESAVSAFISRQLAGSSPSLSDFL